MPMMNARCDSCGTVFPSGIYIENSTSITFDGVRSGPCPRCGGTGFLVANNTTVDVIGNRVTVKRGWISPENLAVVASSFERFRTAQDNRPQVEAQIADTFPQLRSKVQTMSNERLLLLISMLLTLMATWQNNPPSMDTAKQQVEQTMRAVQESTEQTLAEAFIAYEQGKRSTHAIRGKIIKFFPELRDVVQQLPYPLLISTLSMILAALQRWRPIKAKDFKGLTKEQGDELISEIRAMRTALEKPSDS